MVTDRILEGGEVENQSATPAESRNKDNVEGHRSNFGRSFDFR